MTPEQVANRWIDAFNQHDVAILISLYARDAIHMGPKLRVASPGSDGQIVGQLALPVWWIDTFRRLSGLRYELIGMTCTFERAFIECLRHLPGEEPTTVAEIFEVQRGLIISSRVYNG